MPDTSQAFDDADQLDQLLNDAKASDSIAISTIDDANTIINDFAGKSDDGSWVSLDRSTVAGRLSEIVADPRKVQQGALNLCGPAAFFSQWTKRDPVAFATFATRLFDDGQSAIGSLQVTPTQDLLRQDYSAMLARMGEGVSPQADWMILGSLRNSTDVFWQGTWKGDPQQELSGLTRPEEVAQWFTATGIYASVTDEGKWMTPKGLPHALGLQQLEGVDIALMIHANLMATSLNKPYDNDWLMRQFPNHFVVLLGDVVQDIQTQQVRLTVWTWGEVKPLLVSQKDFVDNYYGAVIAKMPPQ